MYTENVRIVWACCD